MCCRQEVLFRQRSSEISVFEATTETAAKPPSNRRLDPSKAVKKYRRSAAGISKEQQYPARNIDAISHTVDYLANLLIQWDRTLQLTPASSFLELVNFLEDRLRAVQVDLVISQHASKEIQYRLVKIHILSIYFMSDNSKYERRHGMQALHTALSSYWYQPTQAQTDDEILSLAAIVQLDEDLTRLDAHPDDIHTFGAGIMSVYRKHVDITDKRSLPRFEWSLRLISCCNGGEWSNALRLLNECQGHFGVLVACIMAPSLSRIRAKALQAYNVSFMKNERLADTEVARLLSIKDPPAAAEFCALLHLPVEDNMVSFKSGVIHMEWTKKKRDDAFVFRGQVVVTATDRHGTGIPDEAFLATLLG